MHTFSWSCIFRNNIPALPCSRQERHLSKPNAVFVPETPSFLGEHIRKKRIEKGLFQSDLARLFKVTPDCITYWENNRSKPQVQHYPNIIEFLGYFPFELEISTFEGKIKAYRYVNGLSQKSFAKNMGVDPATVNRWEEGKGQGVKKKQMDEV
ncbi:transcriptional repressor DicA [Sphingobacterium daejeonense]|nr:transcriptional repressor DicA [Sphingobacterium daejeonense]